MYVKPYYWPDDFIPYYREPMGVVDPIAHISIMNFMGELFSVGGVYHLTTFHLGSVGGALINQPPPPRPGPPLRNKD